MSLVGTKAAVVSLGMSCQTTLQIDDHADLIAQAIGDHTLKPSSMVFDNIVCEPASAATLIATDTFHPATADEIEAHRGALWVRQKVYFRHECTLRKSRPIEYLRGKVDLARGYRDLAGKFAHLSKKFRRLAQLERLVFVISNTQNDLDEYRTEVRIDPVVSAKAIEALCDTCDCYFGRPCEYIFATYDDRLTGVPDRRNLAVFRLIPDHTEWAGDHAQWQRIFTDYFRGSHTSSLAEPRISA